MDEVNTKEVKISASEAKDHNLPTVEISLNTGATGLSGRKFPVEGDYLVLSGPPGGPLGLRISHIKEVPDKDDWGALVDKRYAKRSPAMGKAEEIEINGAKRSAFTFTTDSGPARAHHLLIVYEVPDSRDGLLIDFYRRAGKTETPTPKTLAADEKFAEISPSLSIRFE